MVKLFLIEDHEMIIVSGLRNIFRPSRDHIEIAGSAPNVDRALASEKLSSSHLIILDLWIPGYDPLESVKLLKERHPAIPVIIFTSEELPLWQWKMMEAGVNGYLTKTCSREEFKLALTHVLNGGSWFTGPQSDTALKNKSRNMDKSLPSMSPIERQIVEFLIRGDHRDVIASKLNTTISIIDKKLAVLRSKFKCRTTVELVKILDDRHMI